MSWKGVAFCSLISTCRNVGGPLYGRGLSSNTTRASKIIMFMVS